MKISNKSFSNLFSIRNLTENKEDNFPFKLTIEDCEFKSIFAANCMEFQKNIHFNNCVFYGHVGLYAIRTFGSVNFINCHFKGQLNCPASVFFKVTIFEGNIFDAFCDFTDTVFYDKVVFKNNIFKGGTNLKDERGVPYAAEFQKPSKAIFKGNSNI